MKKLHKINSKVDKKCASDWACIFKTPVVSRPATQKLDAQIALFTGMCTLNDGRKLLLHWMFTDFVNVTELSNNNIITTLKNIMITNNNSDNSKFNSNSNNDTHTTTTTPAIIQSYLNENMTDPNRLILRTTMTFLIQHNLQYIE